MTTTATPADIVSRRAQVQRDLETAIAQVQEEIRQLEAELAVKRAVERLRAEWAHAAAEQQLRIATTARETAEQEDGEG